MTQSITRKGKTFNSVGEYLLSLARDAGSNASTVKGALTYLKTHRPTVSSPLALLGSKQFRSTHRRTTEWEGRKVRMEASARALAVKAATHAKPFTRLKKLTKKLTPDVYPMARRALETLIGAKIAKAIGGSAWPYQRSASTWAGGNHRTTVVFADTPQASGESQRVWSNNKKWSGNDSYARLSITPRCFELLGTDLIIGGLITLDCVQMAPREYQASWAEQSRGFALKVVSGWIIRGYHVTGGTLEQARNKAASARAKAALDAVLEHTSIDRALLTGVMVRESDSWRAGNCRAGTSSFMSTFAAKIGTRREIPAAELLAWRDDLFTRRAVIAAYSRYNLVQKAVAENSDSWVTC